MTKNERLEQRRSDNDRKGTKEIVRRNSLTGKVESWYNIVGYNPITRISRLENSFESFVVDYPDYLSTGSCC